MDNKDQIQSNSCHHNKHHLQYRIHIHHHKDYLDLDTTHQDKPQHNYHLYNREFRHQTYSNLNHSIFLHLVHHHHNTQNHSKFRPILNHNIYYQHNIVLVNNNHYHHNTLLQQDNNQDSHQLNNQDIRRQGIVSYNHNHNRRRVVSF